MYKESVDFIRSLYGDDFIPLHAPIFTGNEKKYLEDCIDSTFVSSVGQYVIDFEKKICELTDANFAVATVNGTAALHMALIVAGVDQGDEVITQAMTFVATANAISYQKATPVFVDVSLETLGMCPKSLAKFLEDNAQLDAEGICRNKKTNSAIKACVPMHTFGHPVELDEIIKICKKWNIIVIEDGAESLGSFYKNKSTISYADIGITSFNGNKIVTSGAGGVITFKNEELAKKAKHLTTTAKVPDRWEFFHDEIGYNYRLPNINAALACAQLEQLESYLCKKREVAKKYEDFFKSNNIKFITEPKNTKSNYWLNAIQLESREERDKFLEYTNDSGVMTRPLWRLMSELPAFKSCQKTELTNSKFLVDRIVNIPSSVV